MIEWKDLQDEFKLNCEEVFEWLSNEYSKISSGRVNPNMFNNLKVEAYGSLTPLIELANTQAVDARQLLIKPYDRSIVKDIAKALTESNFNVNPQVNPDSIRIIFAPLTEESRRASAKKAKEYLEQAKIKIRNIRQDIQSQYKRADDISDDLLKYYEDELNKFTKLMNSKAEEIFEKKEKDLMSM